jgi:uncharacterized Zn-finger protein
MAHLAGQTGKYLSLKESVKISWWLDTVPGSYIYTKIMKPYSDGSNVIYTNEETVSCDGYDEVQQEATHPKVYYTLKEYKNGQTKAVCFYCGKVFIYKS